VERLIFVEVTLPCFFIFLLFLQWYLYFCGQVFCWRWKTINLTCSFSWIICNIYRGLGVDRVVVQFLTRGMEVWFSSKSFTHCV
jgi:hypothetical protein